MTQLHNIIHDILETLRTPFGERLCGTTPPDVTNTDRTDECDQHRQEMYDMTGLCCQVLCHADYNTSYKGLSGSNYRFVTSLQLAANRLPAYSTGTAKRLHINRKADSIVFF